MGCQVAPEHDQCELCAPLACCRVEGVAKGALALDDGYYIVSDDVGYEA